MGEFIKITASDGHVFDAYKAVPTGQPRGGLVVVQEIFGVNEHMRHMTEHFAKLGYLALSPALFDRVERHVDLGYDGEDRTKAMALRAGLSWDKTLLDIEATVKTLHELQPGKVGAVGYCYGGTVVWLAAARLEGLAAVSSYYGGGIGGFAEETAKCPVQFHFGELDQRVPLAEVEILRAAQPKHDLFIYAGADHGFNCNPRPSYNPEVAALAEQRTLALFASHIG